MEKYEESFARAERYLQTADHLTNITLPLIREKRLLLKVLEEIANSIIYCINALLQYEFIHSKIQIYKTAKENLSTFKTVALSKGLAPEILEKILSILAIADKHKKSPLEFVKNEKVVIMSQEMTAETLTLEKIKSFLLSTKYFNSKISQIISKH